MNAKLAAIKILENAKKALKEKMESLEKAEGKNTAQLNEFKGIPQPPAPKAPEKAIAPTPKIPQPKMPGMGKSSEEMHKNVDMGQADRSLRHAPKGEKGKSYKTVQYQSGKDGSDGYVVGYHLPEGDAGPRKEIYRVQVPKKEYERRVGSITSKHGRNSKSAEIAHEHFKPNLPKSERPLSSFLKKREGKVK